MRIITAQIISLQKFSLRELSLEICPSTGVMGANLARHSPGSELSLTQMDDDASSGVRVWFPHLGDRGNAPQAAWDTNPDAAADL